MFREGWVVVSIISALTMIAVMNVSSISTILTVIISIFVKWRPGCCVVGCRSIQTYRDGV